jgi:hypothetical protein
MWSTWRVGAVCVAVGLTAWGTVATATPTVPPSCSTPPPYNLYWNVGGGNFTNLDVQEYGFAPGSMTQTGNGCSTPNCHPWSQGLWPSISDTAHPINGGVPQNASLDAHVANLKQTVVDWIPDPEWDGNAVFDFEAWSK